MKVGKDLICLDMAGKYPQQTFEIDILSRCLLFPSNFHLSFFLPNTQMITHTHILYISSSLYLTLSVSLRLFFMSLYTMYLLPFIVFILRIYCFLCLFNICITMSL